MSSLEKSLHSLSWSSHNVPPMVSALYVSLSFFLSYYTCSFLLADKVCFVQMFQKGDELVHNVSTEIAKLRTEGKLGEIEKGWFENQLPYTTDDISNPITLYRFRGLFMITGLSSAFALAILVILWLIDRWKDLVNSVNVFISRLLVHFRILLARTIHPSPLDDHIGESVVQMGQGNRQ